MMGQLGLRFLGTPTVHYAGQTVKFPTRKALALFVYLVVEGGTHNREKLVALFWPESDARRGGAALRNTLARLRKALRAAGPPLIADGRASAHGALGFDFGTAFELDLQVVERALQVIQDKAQLVGAQQVGALQAAVSVYRGEFLAGFSLPDAPEFDDWASLQREAWHRRLSLVFDRLSQWQSEGGEVPQAIETAARWVAHDPLNEAAYQRLMGLHFTAGERGRALQIYEECVRLLAEELGAEPAPETQALAEHIRTQDFGLPTRQLTVPHPESALVLPFVGRSREHARLVAAYQNARRGQVQVVIVEGEAGIGKTRLATEFLAWVSVRGADLLRGRAFETGGRLPYQPLTGALRERVDRENAPDDLLSDTWLAELTRLLPELRDRYPDLPDYTREESLARPDKRPPHLFEAVARLGQALSQRKPLVILIDDVQWADDASLDLLHYVGRRWSETNSPILLLLILRVEDLSTTPALMDWLAGLSREVTLTRLKLGPITAKDTYRLTEDLAGLEQGGGEAEEWRSREDSFAPAPLHPVASAFAQWLFDETAGHPFFLAETIKELLEREVLKPQRGQNGQWTIDLGVAMEQIRTLESAPVPPSMREVILARLGRLPPDAVAMLGAAAVIGRDCSFERLGQVSGLTEMEGLTALDALLASRLLLETADAYPADAYPSDERPHDALRPYTFSHDKIRDIVYTELGDARRRIYHRRAFDALESARAAPAELAYHALAARLPQAAFRYSVAAGDEAMNLFAIRDAIQHYERARQEDWASASPQERHHLYTRLGRAFELLNDFVRAGEVYQEMLTLAQDLDYPEMECVALNHLAFVTSLPSSDFETAEALLEQARSVSESCGDKLGLAETEWGLTQLAFATGDVAAILDHGGRARDLARELEQPELAARSLNMLAYGKFWLGKWIEAEALAEEARELFVALGNRAMEAECLSGLGRVQVNQGRLAAGIANGRAAYVISRKIENLQSQVYSAANLVPGLLDSGAYKEALRMAQRGVEIARSLDVVRLLHLALGSLGAAHRALQAHEAALKVHLEMESLHRQPYLESDAAELCADYALAGEWEQAYVFARRALAHRDYVRWPHSPPPRWLEVEALLRGGDVEAAREDVRRFGEQIGDDVRYRIPYLRSLAVLAEWEGETAQAIAHLEAAHVLAGEIGLRGEQR